MIVRFAAIVAVSCVVACALPPEGGDEGEGEAEGDVVAAVDVEFAGDAVAFAVTAAGGGTATVAGAHGDIVVTVPADAVVADGVFSVRVGSVDFGVDSDVVALGPDGSVFLAPVEVRFVGRAGAWAFGSSGDGSDAFRDVAVLDGADVVLSLAHFSNAGVGEGAPPTFAPRRAETIARDEVARALDGGDFDAEAVRAALTDWFTDVEVLVDDAVGNPARYEEAFAGWVALLTVTQSLDSLTLAPLQPRTLALEVRMQRVFHNKARDLCRQMVEEDDLGRLAALGPLFRQADLRTLILPGSGNLPDDLARECPVRAALEDVAVRFDADSEEYVITGRAGYVMAGPLHTNNVDVDFVLLRAHVRGGETRPVLTPNADGTFELRAQPDDLDAFIAATALVTPALTTPLTFSTSVTRAASAAGDTALFASVAAATGSGVDGPDVSVEPGAAADVSVEVRRFNNPVQGVRVTFDVDGGGFLAIPEVTTNGEGRARVRFTAGATAATSTRITAHLTVGDDNLAAAVVVVVRGVVVAVEPDLAILNSGGTAEFSAVVTGAPPNQRGVSWHTSGGSIDGNGVYTAGDPGHFAVVARSKADPLAFDRVFVDVIPGNDLTGTITWTLDGSDHGVSFEEGDPDLPLSVTSEEHRLMVISVVAHLDDDDRPVVDSISCDYSYHLQVHRTRVLSPEDTNSDEVETLNSCSAVFVSDPGFEYLDVDYNVTETRVVTGTSNSNTVRDVPSSEQFDYLVDDAGDIVFDVVRNDRNDPDSTRHETVVGRLQLR